jgi:Tol biopolymer transport system component
MNRPTLSRPTLFAGVVMLSLLATACLPEGVRVPQSELSAMLEPKSGLIAFLGVDGNVYTIDQGGGNETQITSDARSDESGYHIYGLPTWSPDGQSLAFVAYDGQPEQNPDRVSLLTAQRDGTEVVEAHSGTDFVVYWSWAPDSARLGFISETSGGSLAFRTVGTDGSAAEVVDAGNPYYWAWAPNTNAILAHAGGASPAADARLSLLQLDGGVIEQVLDVPPAEFKAPAFSPDGSQVLIAGTTESGASALMVTDVLGGDQRVITEYDGSIAFAWSPNGQRIAYLVSADALLGTPGHLVIADASGKRDPVELPDVDVFAFFWAPDSKSLAYFSEAVIEEEAPAEGDEAEATPTADPSSSTAQDGPFVMSLDVMNANNGDTRNVATYVPSERFLQVLPYFDQYHHALTIWSPDSKNLVVSAYSGDGQPGIWVVAASGRLDPRFVAPGWMGFWSWE